MVLIRDRALWFGFYLLPQRYFCDFDNTPFHFPFQPRENCNSGQWKVELRIWPVPNFGPPIWSTSVMSKHISCKLQDWYNSHAKKCLECKSHFQWRILQWKNIALLRLSWHKKRLNFLRNKFSRILISKLKS